MSAIDQRSSLLGPHVRLPAPHADVVLTAALPGDAPALVGIYSTPSIAHRLYSIPSPFSLDDGEQVIAFEAPATAALLAFLAAPASSPTPAARLSTFPLTAIRIETAPGSFRLVGTLGVHRSDAHPAFATPAGCWDLGYVLVPDVGGRGIATAAVRAAMAVWQEVGDDVQAFGAFVETDNPSSLRVLEKLGFRVVAEFDEAWPEAKGGGIRRNYRLEKAVP